eukprot:scaffold34424_cov75-Phaeocystis_antarctica.AAC.1
MLTAALSTLRPRKKRRLTVHSRRRAGRGCMARSPRQRSVGASAAAAAKSSAAPSKPYTTRSTFDELPASVALMPSIPNPVHRTIRVAHTTRIARASVGLRARRRRQTPSGNGTSHQCTSPMAASIDLPDMYIVGARPIADSVHPACPMAKLTRSRRLAADSRAARNTPLTAAELAAPEGGLRAAAVADGEGEVAAPWAPTLGSASAPRRSRRQLARPRSSRVGSRAMAMAVVKVPTNKFTMVVSMATFVHLRDNLSDNAKPNPVCGGEHLRLGAFARVLDALALLTLHELQLGGGFG